CLSCSFNTSSVVLPFLFMVLPFLFAGISAGTLLVQSCTNFLDQLATHVVKLVAQQSLYLCAQISRRSRNDLDDRIGDDCGAICRHDALSAMMASRAAASGPVGRPRLSRQSASRIASGSAPCWTANENAIAASRALVSAALLDLWLQRKSSPMRP